MPYVLGRGFRSACRLSLERCFHFVPQIPCAIEIKFAQTGVVTHHLEHLDFVCAQAVRRKKPQQRNQGFAQQSNIGMQAVIADTLSIALWNCSKLP